MSGKKELPQNITSKLAAKRRKLKVLKSWSEALMKSLKSMKFSACAQIEILNNFLCVKVPLCIKDIHWNAPPCRELQKIATQYFETIPPSSCCSAWRQLHFFSYIWHVWFWATGRFYQTLNKPKRILKITDETCWSIPKLLLDWLKLNLN